MDFSIGDEATAEIVGVSFPAFGLTNSSPDAFPSSWVRLAAADLAGLIEPGAETPRLVTVSVRGKSSGATGLAVSVVEMDDDTGADLFPAIIGGSLSVS